MLRRRITHSGGLLGLAGSLPSRSSGLGDSRIVSIGKSEAGGSLGLCVTSSSFQLYSSARFQLIKHNNYQEVRYTEDGRKRAQRKMWGPREWNRPFWKRLHWQKFAFWSVLAYVLGPIFLNFEKKKDDTTEFVDKVVVRPYGVMGDTHSLQFSIRNAQSLPDRNTAIVDPTLQENFLAPPAGAVGTSGAIYHWLKLDKFPEEVVTKMYTMTDALRYTYSLQPDESKASKADERTVIHCFQPDFRTGNFSKREAILLLAKAYRNILTEFVRTDATHLRMPPLSSGIYSGDLHDEMYVATKQAIASAFEQLHPHDRRELLSPKYSIDLCVYQERDWDKFANAWASDGHFAKKFMNTQK